ncbi:MAG: translocation/assembly module TamB [Treponema sp.]|nr:translocation/assembly module TamB [Treponema sp.]
MDTASTKRIMLAELFIFLTLAGSTALLFQPLMTLINRHITVVRERFIKVGEVILDRPIRYGSMGPSLIGSVEIRDIVIGAEPDPLAAVQSLYFEYSLWDLLRGKGLGAIRYLVLEGPQFSFDSKRDGDLKNLAGKGQLVLPAKCLFVVKDGAISFSTGRTTLSASDIFLSGEIRDHLISLDGSWQKNQYRDGEITLAGNVTGSFSQKLDRGNMAITIDTIEGKGFTVNRIDLGLSFFEDRIVFKRSDDGLPLTLSAEYFHKTGGFSGSFSADRFSPGSMVRFFGPLENFAPVLALYISGTAGFSFEKGRNERDTTGLTDLAYRFLLSAEGPPDLENSPIRNFIFEGEGSDRQINFYQFVIGARRGSARYTGDILFDPLLPEGSLSFSGFSLTGNGSANGTISFSRTGMGAVLASPSLYLGETVLTSLSGEFIRHNGGGNYTLFFNRGQGLKNSFESRGSLTGTPGYLEGTVEVRDFYISDLVNMVRPFIMLESSYDGMMQKTRLSSLVFFDTDFYTVNYHSNNFEISYGSETALIASIEGSEKHLELHGDLGQLFFGINADFLDLRNINFNCWIDYLDFAYNFEGRIQNQNYFTIQDDHGLSAWALNDEGHWTGSVSGRVIPIPYRGRRAYLNLDASLVYHNSAAWNVGMERLEIREYHGPTEISIRGQANQHGLNLDRVYYTDKAGPLFGSGAAVWNSNFSIIDGSLVLADLEEAEMLAGDLFYESGRLDFRGKLTGFKSERIVPGGKFLVSGEAHGGISKDGYYLVSLSLDSLAGKIGENTLLLSGMALLDPERILLSQTFSTLGNIQSAISYASLDKNAGRLETELQLSGTVNEQDLGILLSLGVNFLPMKTWLDMESLSSLSGILDIKYAYVNEKQTKSPASFAFTRTPHETEKSGALYRLSGGPQNMINAEFNETSPGGGVFYLSLGSPFPVHGIITGVLEGKTFDAFVSEIFVDLKELWDIIPIKKTVDFTGGVITGESRMFGSIFDPEFEGIAWASGITLTVPEYLSAEIGPGSGAVTLAGSGFSFGPVDGVCGNGHGVVSGEITFSRWLPGFYLDIEADRKVPFNFNLSGIRAAGNATGKLQLFLEEKVEFNIIGDIYADDTEITINKEEIERAMTGWNLSMQTDIIADVHITAGQRVEFFWPDSRTPVLRAYGEAGTGVRIMGDSRIPRISMDGDVVLRGGELFQLQRSFFIREGLLQFNGNDPQVDPRISVKAEFRDRNDDGPVTIAMILDRVALSELEKTMPRFETTPSLSQLEIYSILGQAPSLDAAESNTLDPIIKTSIDMILQTVVFRRAERTIRNALGLDMFSFRTQILQNALFEAVRNRDPEEQPSTMGNYLDNTAVFMGKYIGRDLFFQTILSFRYDQYQREFGGMKLEPEIGFDLRTPLFDVRWNLRPLYGENLFVSDQSISLIWRWSL